MLFRQGEEFIPDEHIPDLHGHVILVTGGNSGLGKETVRQLAKHKPSKLYLGARNEVKAQAAIADIKRQIPNANIHFLELNLASFASIATAARKFLVENDRLDILINNAGIFAQPPGLTDDGYEIQFGTNYMGPALLTKLLLPCMETTASALVSDVRIVMVSSKLHAAAPKQRLLLSENKTKLERITTVARYGQSKLAQIYFARSLAKHCPSITSLAVHPGVVRTNIFDGTGLLARFCRFIGHFAFVEVATGALNQLWATSVPAGIVPNGAMLYPVGREYKGRDSAADDDMAEKLWNWTEAELKGKGF